MKCLGRSILLIVALLFPDVKAMAVQPPLLVPEKAVAAPVASPVTNGLPPVAPQRTNSQAPSPAVQSSPPEANIQVAPTGADGYPLIGRMETITFGKVNANEKVDVRLTNLEEAVFRLNYKDESLFDRTQRLKIAILGANDPSSAGDQDVIDMATLPPLLPPTSLVSPQGVTGEVTYFEALAKNANNQIEVVPESLTEFALEQINYARSQIGVGPLSLDKLANTMADEHINDLSKRKVVSHCNQRGANPDRRYTDLGGTGSVSESLATLKEDQLDGNKYTRAMVARLLKKFIDHQDDRDSLLSPDATGFGFAIKLLPEAKKAVACVEVSTNRGAIEPIAVPLKLGDKIEVKGEIQDPYKFYRISLAWEGLDKNASSASDETDEAIPYFPPLDYVSFAHHSEHDYGTAMTALRMGALVGIIAGSMFMPPVALAAPLIAIGPAPGEAKPMSDIPLHGGVKMSGSNFSGKIPLSNAGKSGIYYLTVWAISPKSTKPVPISRRAFVVSGDNDEDSPPIANAKTSS